MDLESQLSRETIPRIKHQYKCKCDLKNMIQKSKETFISAVFFLCGLCCYFLSLRLDIFSFFIVGDNYS